MGIYINGMEMPKEGEWISVNISHDGKCFVLSWCGKDFNFAAKLTAVPVQKHGRLGDLDALAQQIEHERFHHTHTDGLAARHHVAEYGHFLKAISDAPTVIPADEPDMDSFIRIFEEDDKEDGMDSFIRILKD